MDYKTKMENKKINFFEFYSQRMKQLEEEVDIPESISTLLQEKRNFGVDKYKEFSFQSTFENAITSPSEEHLREELIDAINYTLHSMYKSILTLQESPDQKLFLESLIKLYNKSFDSFPDM